MWLWRSLRRQLANLREERGLRRPESYAPVLLHTPVKEEAVTECGPAPQCHMIVSPGLVSTAKGTSCQLLIHYETCGGLTVSQYTLGGSSDDVDRLGRAHAGRPAINSGSTPEDHQWKTYVPDPDMEPEP